MFLLCHKCSGNLSTYHDSLYHDSLRGCVCIRSYYRPGISYQFAELADAIGQQRLALVESLAWRRERGDCTSGDESSKRYAVDVADYCRRYH